MSRNMAPCMVPTTTSCGVRRNLRAPRLAMTKVLEVRLALWAAGAAMATVVSFRCDVGGGSGDGCALTGATLRGRRCGLQRLSGESEEDLVELGVPYGDILERWPDRHERREFRDELSCPGRHRHAHPPGRLVDLRLAVAEFGQGSGNPHEVLGVPDVDLDHAVAGPLLELRR